MWSSTKSFSSLTCRSQVAKLRWYGSHNCLRSYVALPGAYIEKCCQGDIGEGTKICSNAVVGPSVKIGKNCVIGAGAVIQNANISDNVVIHPGVCIGQDGFGFDIGKTSHKKKPQTLKVIVEHDVEIGANTTIDRGSWRDTVIGEGTKIDNLVQIGHNVEIGKHCLIAAQTGIAGSTSLGDHCLVGGQTGIAQHLKVGSHVQIAAKSGVMSDLESGKQYGGVPAVPIRDFHRQTIFLRRAAGN